MSDWGLVSFYYDYDKKGYWGDVHHNGLVSKAYKYPGVLGMILHAYYGVKYFMDMQENEGLKLDGSLALSDMSDHSELNAAFDVFFMSEFIMPGFDCVKYALTELEKSVDDKKLDDALFNCEGMYGWIYIDYTGDIESGYKMKYGYYYGACGGYAVGDLDRALDILVNVEKRMTMDEITDDVKEAVEFFKENAVLMTKDEFRAYEDRGREYIRKVMEDDK